MGSNHYGPVGLVSTSAVVARVFLVFIRYVTCLALLFLPATARAGLLVGLDGEGEERWEESLDDSGDISHAGPDGDGNIFVGYASYSWTTDVSAFASDGQLVGQWSFEGIFGREFLALDFGFVIMGDYSEQGQIVTAYDYTGNQLWSNLCEDVDYLLALRADPVGGFVVAGDTIIEWLNAAGELTTQHSYRGCSTGIPDFVFQSDGTLVTAGCGDENTVVQWFDVHGELVHSEELPSTAYGGEAVPRVVLDGDGNALVVNRCAAEEGCIAKLSTTGKVLWQRRFAVNEANYSFDIAVDADGQATVGIGDYYYADVVKFDSSGSVLWTDRIESEGWLGATGILDTEADIDGNSYIEARLCDLEGYDGGCEDGAERYETIKYDSGGNRLWTISKNHADIFNSTGSSLRNQHQTATGSIFLIVPVPNAADLLLSRELDPSADDSGPAVYYDDDSDSAGCGC